MSISTVPDVQCRELSSVDPGTLIQYRDELAITMVGTTEDSHTKPLAIYLSESRNFVLRRVQADSEIVHFSEDLILEIDVSQVATDDTPRFESGMQLFLLPDGPCVVARAAHHRDWAFVNLRTGAMPRHDGSLKPSFAKWRLGVRGADACIWLIEAPAAND